MLPYNLTTTRKDIMLTESVRQRQNCENKQRKNLLKSTRKNVKLSNPMRNQ